MDLRKIENLIHVADSGSFSKAASVLGIAQSALGRQVRKLEDECGCALLYRNGRGVSLTPEGEKLLDSLRPLLAQMARVVTEFHDEQKSPSGQVTLGLTPTLSHMVGMPLVAEIWKRHPRIQLNVITGYSGYVHEWLANARVDIAVLHDARRSQHVVVDPLAELDLALVSPAQNLSPAARALSCIDFSQLADLPLALPTRSHGLRRTLEQAAAQADAPLNVVFEMDALELMKEIVLNGLAHTVLALPAVVGELNSGQLVARRIVNPALSTRLMLATASNRPLTQAVKIVQDILRELLEEMVQAEPYRSYMRMAGGVRDYHELADREPACRLSFGLSTRPTWLITKK